MIERGRSTNPVILVVDDEPEVVESLVELLRRDFRAIGTSDPREAIDIIESRPLVAIVSDQRMAEVTGVQILAVAAQAQPDAARILLTAYSDIEALADAVNQGRLFQYVSKPWNGDELLALLRDAAQRHRLIHERHLLVRQLAEVSAQFGATREQVAGLEGERSALRLENETLREAYEHLRDSFWHLKKIQEILPICMECGRVKAEGARWTDVVDYLKAHSMFLSHGYCPECSRQLFGEDEEDEEVEE